MEFRKIKTSDKEDIYRLLCLLNPEKAEKTEFDLKALVEDNNANCIVMVDNEKIIGYGEIAVYSSAMKEKAGVIEDIILDPEYRGRGLGRDLMRELIGIGRDKGVKVFMLTSNPERKAARRLYESLGFNLADTGVFYLQSHD